MNLSQNIISVGDRICARLIINGTNLAEVVSSNIPDMKHLLRELRRLAIGFKGMATLFVRNSSRGWRLEKQLLCL